MEPRFLILPGFFDGPDYEADIHLIPGGQTYPLHWHDYYEFELVLEGRGMHFHNEKSYPVSEGSAYLMSYLNYHSLYAETDLKILNVSFGQTAPLADVTEFLAPGPNIYSCRFQGEDFNFLSDAGRWLREDTDKENPADSCRGRALLTVLVTSVLKKCAPIPCSGGNPVAQRALSYINERFRQGLSLSEIAAGLSVSTTYLGSVFRKETGMSFNQYLSTIRLRYACGLLESTLLPVKDVAAASGFASTEYFLFVFKQKMGITPGQFRRESRGFLAKPLHRNN